MTDLVLSPDVSASLIQRFHVFPMKQILILLLLIVSCLGLLSGCGRAAADSDLRSVWVTILPQKFFVERIAGDAVTVDVLVRAGQSPELYAPSAAQMARLARADLFFGIGVPVEAAIFPRMARSMPGVRVLSTGPLDPYSTFACGGDHDHDHDHAHHHEGADPHVWVDPVIMAGVVAEIRDALIAIDPANANRYRENTAILVAELEALDAELKAQFAPYAERAFYINHPSLGYFAERYGLRQVSIEQAGTDPSARRIANLVAHARADAVGAILQQPEFGRSSASVLSRALEVPVIEVNPLAEDYINNMRDMADAVERSFAR